MGWNPDDAVKDYIARINAKIPDYEPVNEPDFTFIKLINVNQRMEVRNATGYLASRIVFYLMNLHTQRRTIYFARAGRSTNTTHKSDEGLSDEGNQYAKLLADALLSFREVEHAKEREQGEKPRSLTVPPQNYGLTFIGLDVNPSPHKADCSQLPGQYKTLRAPRTSATQPRRLRRPDTAANPRPLARRNGQEKTGSVSSSVPPRGIVS